MIKNFKWLKNELEVEAAAVRVLLQIWPKSEIFRNRAKHLWGGLQLTFLIGNCLVVVVLMFGRCLVGFIWILTHLPLPGPFDRPDDRCTFPYSSEYSKGSGVAGPGHSAILRL